MKKANLIAIGGPVAVGKSTQVKILNFPYIDELEENDVIQKILLNSTYSKERVSPEIIEYYFLKKRIDLYKEFGSNMSTFIFDRTIFESLWFAKENLSDASYKAFEILWTKEIENVILKVGIPKAYLILDMDWNTFENRLFRRGRKEELENFYRNKVFFQKHISEFSQFLLTICKKYKIKYYYLKTDNFSEQEINQKLIKMIKEVN